MNDHFNGSMYDKVLISIDPGLKNLAFCVVTSTVHIVSWKRVNLFERDNVLTYSPKTYSMAVRMAFTTMAAAARRVEARQVTVIIERQPTKVRFQSNVHHRVIAVEAMLHALAVESGFECEEYAPQIVSRLFKLRGERSKKKASSSLVEQLLQSDECLISSEGGLIEAFENSVKKDDLSDCLLQALAYLAQHDKHKGVSSLLSSL